MSDIRKVLLGQYRLVTAVVRYYMPDYPGIIAPEFIWQQYDRVPEYPNLNRFIEFWQKEIEGRLHSIRVANVELINPNEYRHLEHAVDLNGLH